MAAAVEDKFALRTALRMLFAQEEVAKVGDRRKSGKSRKSVCLVHMLMFVLWADILILFRTRYL